MHKVTYDNLYLKIDLKVTGQAVAWPAWLAPMALLAVYIFVVVNINHELKSLCSFVNILTLFEGVHVPVHTEYEIW